MVLRISCGYSQQVSKNKMRRNFRRFSADPVSLPIRNFLTNEPLLGIFKSLQRDKLELSGFLGVTFKLRRACPGP